MMDLSPTSGVPDQTDHHYTIRLACQACQRKKIKCDRTFPCGQCTRSNLQCLASSRKPRARHTGKRPVDSELRSRISKLENLVETLSGEAGIQGNTTESDAGDPNGAPDLESPVVGKYIGSPFWASLTTEVQALREALEDDQAEEEEQMPPSAPIGSINASEYDLIICPPGHVYIMPGALPEPTPELSAMLCNFYCDNVDRMFKFHHGPSLRKLMIEGKRYLGFDPSSPSIKALKAAIWFAAVNSMSEEQSLANFGRTRADQMQIFRRMTDVAMSQADLMGTNDFPTLQALTTYIAASRMTDPSRRVWTLTALLVRIGRGMELYKETAARPVFENELRRRLWHMIVFLDMFSSLDRATMPIVTADSYTTPRARNVNDSEFDESSTFVPDHENGLTDMSFAQLAYETTMLSHRLTMPETKPTGENWKQRLELAEDFGVQIRNKYIKYCTEEDDFHRLIASVATSMIAGMKLRAVRPLHRSTSSPPPPVSNPFVLQIARDSLKATEAVYADPRTAKYRWIVWVPWHPLAVAIAGLCAIRDTELAKDAWIYVERSYERQGKFVADQQNGMLWRPIERLYKKARAFREHREESPSSTEASPPQQAPMGPANPQYALPQIDTILPQTFPTDLPDAMPTSTFDNNAMDMTFSNNLLPIDGVDGMDTINNSLDWMDFQNILQDMSTTAAPMNYDGSQWSHDLWAPPNWSFT